MINKKKVIMKASFKPEDKEKLLKFNSTVRKIAKNKIESGTASKPREMIKVIGATSINVTLNMEGKKLKVLYTVNGTSSIDELFSKYNDFDNELKAVEDSL